MKALYEYIKKRNFHHSHEPEAKLRNDEQKKPLFVIQEHHASHLHFDFRLEINGVLKSWAVPKGPSLSPSEKRLAIQAEDHPLQYASFEGTIPEGEYGAGEVMIWDKGAWIPEEDPELMLKKGHLAFTLSGKKMKGKWDLIRTAGFSKNKNSWLLIRRKDQI